MLVVTTNEIHGWELQRVCGEVYGVTVRVSNDPGNPADSRAAAVARMLEHTRAKGGNAVVGMRIDSASLSDGRVEICAYGTAVVAAPTDDGARQTATALGYGQPGGGGAAEDSPAGPPNGQPNEQQPSPQPYEPQPQYNQPQQPQQPYQQPQQYPPGYPPQQYPPGYPQQPYQQPQQYPPGYPGPQ